MPYWISIFALVILACAFVSASPAEPEYRYDDLPAKGSTDAAIAEYQAITIQRLDGGWFITAVNFFDAPSFCN